MWRLSAVRKAALAAASNWHALARYVGRFAPDGGALLVDVGSTTCDIIPLHEGEPVATGETDTQRLLAGELVYTGVERTPICALVSTVPYRENVCPVAHELFASMLDAYLITGEIAEEPTYHQTADGKPAVKGAARVRLGRMICADRQEFNHRDAVAIALAAVDAQTQLIADTVKVVLQRFESPLQIMILSGQGEFLARRVVQKLKLSVKTISLAKELGKIASRCATAHALATLTREAEGDSAIR